MSDPVLDAPRSGPRPLWRRAAGLWLRLCAPQPDSSYRLASWLFLRLVGLCFLCAFLSFWVQARGLVGHDGILQATDLLGYLRQRLGGAAYLRLPTLLWLHPGDAALHAVCCGGTVLSVLLCLDLLPAPVLLLLYAGYLSLMSVGRLFTGYQWDALLLETGALAFLLAPARLRRARALDAVAPLALLLLYLLLFRLMFCAGAVKLLSHDETWRDLSALDYHFYTQPIPNPPAWWAQQLPQKLRHAMTFLVLATELAAPWLIWLGRRPRRLAAALLILLQLAIALCGNYGFFNLLSIALCVLLLDDDCLHRVWPRGLRPALPGPHTPPVRRPVVRAAALTLCGGVLLIGAVEQICGQLLRTEERSVEIALSPFELVNRYGLFASMTTERPEIVFEGSQDGQRWLPYEFPYKPGALDRPLPWVAPHMPRLDWQLWFAALRPADRNPWLQRLGLRLLEGSPSVLALLAHNPFPDAPPRYVRATLYDYRFTDLAQRRKSGALWQRQELGPFIEPMSLR